MGFVVASRDGWYYAGQHNGWDLWSKLRAAAWSTVYAHVAHNVAVRLANGEGQAMRVCDATTGHPAFTVQPNVTLPAPTHARSMASVGDRYHAMHPGRVVPRADLNSDHCNHYHCGTCGTCLGHPNDCHECRVTPELRRGS